jgi:hypothetical protein
VSDYERKRLGRPFTVKAVDDQGVFEGHGAVFDELHPTSSWRLSDDWQDLILPGSLSATLAEHRRVGSLPPMLYMHERGNVIGAWREMAEDDDGLRVKGQVALSAKAPSDVTFYDLLKMGALTGMSIGFWVTKAELDEKKKIRSIEEVELGELSIVDVPGIASARITDVKTANPIQLKRRIEEALRDAGLSRSEAKAFIADGFEALRDAAPDDEGPAARDATSGDGAQTLRDAGDGSRDEEVVARLTRLASLIHS